MFQYESDTQARRKTFSVLQDETRKVLESSRELSNAYTSLIKDNKKNIESALQIVGKAEGEVSAQRKLLTRELTEIGAMIVNREDLLRIAYHIEELSGFIRSIIFKISHLNNKVLKIKGIGDGLGTLIDMAVEEVQILNNIVRALSINPEQSIHLSNDLQNIERIADEKYRDLTVLALEEINDFKDLIILKDIIDGVENMVDRCLVTSDSIVILALGL